MKQFFKDLLEGRFEITYTLTKIESMVPREIRWLGKIPVLGDGFRIGQFFWFMTKVIFFATIVSWFKPQYHHVGAKIALFLISFGLIFLAGWLMKKERDRREIAK